MIVSRNITQCPVGQPQLCPDQLTLVHRLCSGDPDAFRQVDELYRTRLYRFAVRIVKSHQDAEDAVQDTFLRAFLKFDTFHGRSSIYTWLISILLNCCLGHLRKSKRHPVSRSLDECGGYDEPWSSFVVVNDRSSEESLIKAEQVEILRKAIHCLPSDFRFILNARTREALSLEEIAQQLQISLPATKSRALRAHRQAVRNARIMIGLEATTASPQRKQ